MAEQKESRRDARRRAAGKAKGGPPRRGPFSLTTGWAAVLFALLVVLFFHEVSLGGKTFTSPDTIAPVGFVRMGEKALYEQHTYPLWNPFVFLGMPSFASGAYNPLIYPPDWPLALLNKVVPLPDMTWLLLYYFIGALAMYLLAREWGARAEGALLAGAVFVFAPNLVAVGSHGHGSQLVNSAYLPLMLWLAARWLRRGTLADLGFLALAGGFQMLRGHVQISFYTWGAIAVYAVFHWIVALRDPERRVSGTVRAAAIAGAALLAFGLAGFYNLPLRDYAQYSIRGGSDEAGGVGMAYATQWSLGLYELPSIVFPGWVGFGSESYWGGMPFTDYPNAYLGIIAILFAVPALLGRGGPRLFAIFLALASLLVAFGYHTPVYAFLYDHLPLFNKFRVPVMVVILFQLAAALALAWGWSDVLAARDADDARRARMERTLLVLAAVVVAVCLGGALLQGAWSGAYVRNALAHQPDMPPEVASGAAQALAGDLVREGLLGLIAIAAAWLALRRRVSITLATGVTLAALLVELWPVSGRVMKPVIGDPPPDVMEVGRNDTVRWLETVAAPSEYRIFPIDEFQSNRFAGFGIPSLGGYHAAKPRLIQDLFDANVTASPRWQRLLNLRFILIQRQYQEIPPYLRPVYEGQTNTVLQNLLALPRATVVGRYEVVQPARAIIDSVTNGILDPAEVTYLESDPGLALGPVEGATARITAYNLNDVTVEVSTPGPALLRLADQWYPDWKATVDGKSAPILRADYLLRAVPVPAGDHTVVFRFQSAAVRNGLTLTLISTAMILGLLFAGWRQGRRPRAAAAAAGTAARG
jgi:hypothetical protein